MMVLVAVLFREAFSHPYISFFHLLVNGFSEFSLKNGTEPLKKRDSNTFLCQK